jgi:hypothetical protein
LADELNRLSPEQVKKLGDAINGAKNLTNQQAEIIERVIQGEIEINNLRMANLQSYFDVFSRNLDLVARKFSSINDTCLIINEQLSDASEFAIKHDLKGFFTSMFISNKYEAACHGFNGENEDIYEQTRHFLRTLNNLVKNNVPMEEWIDTFNNSADMTIPYVKFNYEALGYFD